MKTLKKNQIVVFVIGLMIITAGYLSFTNNQNNNLLETSAISDSEEMASIGDARLVSANVAETNQIDANTVNEAGNASSNVINNEVNEYTNSEVVRDSNSIGVNDVSKTSTNTISTDEYFTNSRLERNTMYSQQIENYQNILSNTNASETQKQTASEEITRINNEQNAIMIAENLIKTKGIEDLIIFVNGDSINVIVKGADLEKEEIAQIQNIVTRELEADIADVHIMNKE